MSYTHRTLVAQHGHRLFVDFATTKGLRLDFTYSRDCDIRNIDVLDYTSGTRPRIEHSPPGVPDPLISIDYGHHWDLPTLRRRLHLDTPPRSGFHGSGY